MSPALAGGFLPTGPPGKSLDGIICVPPCWTLYSTLIGMWLSVSQLAPWRTLNWSLGRALSWPRSWIELGSCRDWFLQPAPLKSPLRNRARAVEESQLQVHQGSMSFPPGLPELTIAVRKASQRLGKGGEPSHSPPSLALEKVARVWKGQFAMWNSRSTEATVNSTKTSGANVKWRQTIPKCLKGQWSSESSPVWNSHN